MKRAIVTAALLSLVFVVPVLAADGGKSPSTPGQTFEQRQANILKILDERIVSLQAGKTCVQSAKTDDDLRACREKHMSEMREKHMEMRQ